jgi:prepilin-type N-terminal cleavage/methylation domain-containing protein
MIRHIREIQARRRGEELDFEAGFTLIELLIVIVVLGILAATVVFALSSVTGTSAIAACNADAKSYEVAVAAYQNATTNAQNTPAPNTNALIPTYLHAAANNPAYIVAITGDNVLPTGVQTGVKNTAASTTMPVGPAGTVYVGLPGQALVAYDSQGAGLGCNAA